MKNPFKIASWLNIQQWQDDAKDFARNVASRHDVPTHVQAYDDDGGPVVDTDGRPVMVQVKPDLRDIKGRWWGTSDNRSLSAVLLIEDMIVGGQSAITPILMGLVTVLTVLAASIINVGRAFPGTTEHPTTWLFFGASGFVALLVLALFTMLWYAIGAKGNRMVLVGCVLVPLFGVLSAMLPEGLSSGANILSTLKSAAIPIGIGAFLLFTFLGKRDTTNQILFGIFKAMAFFTITATIAQFVLPLWLQPAYWALLGCTMPLWWVRHERRIRTLKLASQAMIGSGDLGKLGNTSPQKRLAQAQNAERDKSLFIRLGTAQGKFTNYGDGFAYDAGLPSGLTCDDLRTHLHVFGKTGGGKTFNVAKPTVMQWCEGNAGGVLLLDGKGSLPEEMLGKFTATYGFGQNVLLINSRTPVGPMQGLSPNDFIDAISDIGGAKKQEQSQDSTEFFNTQAYTLGLSLGLILEALVKNDRRNEKRSFFWTLDSIDRLKSALKLPTTLSKTLLGTDTANGPAGIRALDEYSDSSDLRDAVRFLEMDFWTMPADTSGSVVAVLDNWIKPLMQHPELRWWSTLEEGVDVTIPLFGGFVGAALPEVKYGIAGKLAQSLIKQRLFVKIRRRGDYDWRAAGETPVLFATDEAPELISKADRDFMPQSRSLGGYAAYFAQNVDAYEAKMGVESTSAFLDNFRSLVAFKSSPRTYEFISKEMGEGKFVSWKESGQAIGFMKTAVMVASHPLYDKNHPYAKEMSSLRRRGAGNVMIPTGAPVSAQGPSAQARVLTRSMHDPSDMPDNAASSLSFTAVVSSEIKHRPLLMLADCQAELNSEQDAIAMFQRGGSSRWDFIHFETQTPAQIKEMERKFHRSLIFNGLVKTIQTDIVDALGARPKVSVMKRLTNAYLHLSLTDDSFAPEAMKAGELSDADKAGLITKLAAVDAATLDGAQLREQFIDRWEADYAQLKLAA